MGIIEKLGITPISVQELIIEHHSMTQYAPKAIRKVEQQRNKLLEALIETLIHWENNRYFPNGIYQKNIKAIEKACYPLKWEEIKELL